MPKTKQLFIEYHRRAWQAPTVALGQARPPAPPRVRRDAEAAWQTLTAVERANLVRCINERPDAYSDRDFAQPALDAAYAQAQMARYATPVDWTELVVTAEDAEAALSSFLPLQQRVQVAAFNLEQLLLGFALPAPVAVLVQTQATAERVVEDRTVRRIQRRIVRLQRRANRPPVPRWNGTFKMLKSSLGRARRAARTHARNRAFRTLLPPLPVSQPGRDWLGCWPCGKQGGMSTTGLWVSVDDQQVVNFRTMRKEVRLSKNGWKSIEYFDGDVRSRANRMPLEISCHQHMQELAVRSGSTGQRLVPPVLSAIVDDAECMYTLYLGYCPGGDLSTLIRTHRDAGM